MSVMVAEFGLTAAVLEPVLLDPISRKIIYRTKSRYITLCFTEMFYLSRNASCLYLRIGDNR